MKIGVTGATGRLGRLVVSELLERCAASEIVAVVRDPKKASEMVWPGLEVIVADYDDPPSLRSACTHLDTLLLISSNAMGRRVAQHSNVIDAAKAAGVERLVYTSAPQATTSRMGLAVEHKASEEYLADSGLTYTILRNNWYTENYGAAIKVAAVSGFLVAPPLVDRVASATRSDYAAGAAEVLLGDGHEHKVYEFSGDRSWDLAELAETVTKVSGRPCELQSVEQEELISALVLAGMDETVARYYSIASTSMAGGSLAVVSPELATLIGRPTTALEDAVKAMLGY